MHRLVSAPGKGVVLLFSYMPICRISEMHVIVGMSVCLSVCLSRRQDGPDVIHLLMLTGSLSAVWKETPRLTTRWNVCCFRPGVCRTFRNARLSVCLLSTSPSVAVSQYKNYSTHMSIYIAVVTRMPSTNFCPICNLFVERFCTHKNPTRIGKKIPPPFPLYTTTENG